jgi:DNA polymerase elongation subunit (family B)
VSPTQPGVYKDIGGLYFKSLYPKTMIQHNLSPETFLFKDTNGTYIPKPNEIKVKSGAVFTKDFEGIVPKILRYYFAARKESKAKRKQVDYEYETLKHIFDERKAKMAKVA